MLLAGSVTSFAGDRSERRPLKPPSIRIRKARASGMTKKTSIAHRAIEIDYGSRGIPWRNIPSITFKPRGGRLKQIIADLHQVTATHKFSAHLVAHRIFRRKPAFREAVNHMPIRVFDGDYTMRMLVRDSSRRLRLRRNKRLAHRRGKKARVLFRVAGGAVWRCGLRR